MFPKKCFFIILFLLVPLLLHGQLATLDDNSPITINNWLYWQSSDGASGYNFFTNERESNYPKHAARVLYFDGLLWGGFVRGDGSLEERLRVGGQFYRSGTQPGWIISPANNGQPAVALDPESPQARVYRVRSDIHTVTDIELAPELAAMQKVQHGSIAQTQIDSLRQHYLKDWQEWPAQAGAPYYDRNQNGKWDADFDEPGTAGADQVLWCAVNDLSEAKSYALFATPPVGLELQITIWAYKFEEAGLGQTIFKRFKLINKSNSALDSLFFGFYADTDLGMYGDDLLGCDTTLEMSYTYNGDAVDAEFSKFGMTPPAVGYVLLQGPIVPSADKIALVNFNKVENNKNLDMTSFWWKYSGYAVPDPAGGHFEGAVAMYNLLNGLLAMAKLGYIRPQVHYPGNGTSEETKFPVNGDPVTGSGVVDNASPGDRRFLINSGPFTLEPGQSQEIVFAIVGAQADEGGDHISSVKNLQETVPVIHDFYQNLVNFEAPTGPVPGTEEEVTPDYPVFILGQNYPNPFNNSTTIRFRLLSEMDVTVDIYNTLGQRIKRLAKGKLAKQEHLLSWDGTNEQGLPMSSGVYIVRVQSGLKIQTKKLILLK